MSTIRERKDDLINKINHAVSTIQPSSTATANLKFALLFRTRLMEEGIPKDHAEKILEHTAFDFSEVNEEDDWIGDVALKYAELVKFKYDIIVKLFNLNNVTNFDVIAQQICKFDLTL